MSKIIDDQWTPLRHETLATAKEYSRWPSHYVLAASGAPVPPETTRTLGWFARNGLTEQRPAPEGSTARAVDWTMEGRRVLKAWNARYGTPGETLSHQAIAAIPEITAYLDKVQRHYRGDVSGGIGVAGIKLMEQYRKATGTEGNE